MYLYLNIKTASKDWQNLQRPYQQGRDLLFIRMLLQKRKGIGSFSELRTVGDIEYVTAEKRRIIESRISDDVMSEDKMMRSDECGGRDTSSE